MGASGSTSTVAWGQAARHFSASSCLRKPRKICQPCLIPRHEGQPTTAACPWGSAGRPCGRSFTC
eukprot:scaffold651771_cov41-Prasinocladus_malaysianus.AAC.1